MKRERQNWYVRSLLAGSVITPDHHPDICLQFRRTAHRQNKKDDRFRVMLKSDRFFGSIRYRTPQKSPCRMCREVLEVLFWPIALHFYKKSGYGKVQRRQQRRSVIQIGIKFR